MFVFLLLIGEYFPQFIANIRQEIRNTEAVGVTSGLTLTKCITDLLDENTAQTNEGSSSAVLIAIRKTALPKPAQVDDRANMKCIYCRKTRYLEHECYVKHPEKKAAFDKMLAEKKALKKQQALLKATPSAFVATATTTTPPLPPSALYKFGYRARTFIAVVLLPSSNYTFDKEAYTNIAEIDSN